MSSSKVVYVIEAPEIWCCILSCIGNIRMTRGCCCASITENILVSKNISISFQKIFALCWSWPEIFVSNIKYSQRSPKYVRKADFKMNAFQFFFRLNLNFRSIGLNIEPERVLKWIKEVIKTLERTDLMNFRNWFKIDFSKLLRRLKMKDLQICMQCMK